MADVSCWSCGSGGNVQVYCPPKWNGEEYAGGGWISVPTPDDMTEPSCPACRAKLKERHCPAHYATYQTRTPLSKRPIGGGMRSATGEPNWKWCPCDGGLWGKFCDMDDFTSCKKCCDFYRPIKDEMRSATGETFGYNVETMNNLVGFVALTSVSAIIGSKIAKDKKKGAIIGGVGYAVAVLLYMKLKPQE